MAPTVSVITPTLNSASFLPELLACLEHQDYPSIDHVVVDGGSTDGTLEMLARCDPGKHRYFARVDRSMYEAINFGIESSTGEIVSCLNADDLYFPDSVSCAAAFLDRNPGVDIAYGDQLTVLTAEGSFDLNIQENAYSDPWGKVLVYITQPAVFVRRSVFERVGLFDGSLKAAGDFDFWFRAFQKGMIFRRLPRLLTIVRIHGKNLSLGGKWAIEHEDLKTRYLPGGWRRRAAEAYRLFKRKLRVNQLTLPFLASFPAQGARFDRGLYFRYLVSRRVSDTPLLRIDLPYFRYEAYRALNLRSRT